MEGKKSKLIVSVLLVLAASCNEPETVVTNIVHADGSVTRRVEMRNSENKFEISGIQVPLDSTWSIRDSLEISAKGDTLWIKRAEKHFMNAADLTNAYRADSGANRETSRSAEFGKRFKWFNTEYRFAEIIDRKISHGYPLSVFLNREELHWFYTPDIEKEKEKNGTDSLKYKALNDTVDKKAEKWLFKCLVSEWIFEFARLTKGRSGDNLTEEALKKHEDEFMKILEANGDKADSLWSDGTLLREIIGEEDAVKFKSEADSAVNIAVENILIDFKDYTVMSVMPGKLTATNGFIDSSGVVLWPVKSDFFLTQDYEMWAESKSQNKWAWVLTGIFILFVLTGVILKRKRKG
jgi:hypothetical protein